MLSSNRAESADLKILIADASLHADYLLPRPAANKASPLNYSNLQSISKQLLCDEYRLSTRGLTGLDTEVFDRDGTIIVMNKTDLLTSEMTERHTTEIDGVPVCWISCKTGNGVDDFMDSLKKLLEQMYINLYLFSLCLSLSLSLSLSSLPSLSPLPSLSLSPLPSVHFLSFNLSLSHLAHVQLW